MLQLCTKNPRPGTSLPSSRCPVPAPPSCCSFWNLHFAHLRACPHAAPVSGPSGTPMAPSPCLAFLLPCPRNHGPSPHWTPSFRTLPPRGPVTPLFVSFFTACLPAQCKPPVSHQLHLVCPSPAGPSSPATLSRCGRAEGRTSVKPSARKVPYRSHNC